MKLNETINDNSIIADKDTYKEPDKYVFKGIKLADSELFNLLKKTADSPGIDKLVRNRGKESAIKETIKDTAKETTPEPKPLSDVKPKSENELFDLSGLSSSELETLSGDFVNLLDGVSDFIGNKMGYNLVEVTGTKRKRLINATTRLIPTLNIRLTPIHYFIIAMILYGKNKIVGAGRIGSDDAKKKTASVANDDETPINTEKKANKKSEGILKYL